MTPNTSTTSTTKIDRGLLLIRIALGIVFVMHGWQKLTVFGLAGTAGFLAQVHVPYPTVNAVLITATELVGGLALLAGLGTRIAAGLLAFSMTVAILSVHVTQGFFLPTGYEYALTLLILNLGVTLTGAGAFSLDAKIFAPRGARAIPAIRAAA